MLKLPRLPFALFLVACSTHDGSNFTAQTEGTCSVAPSGLVAWYSGDTDGTDSGDNHTGTLLGGASVALGEVGNGFHLDGQGGGVQIPDNPDLALGSGDFTIETWVSVEPSTSSHEYLTLAAKLDALGRGFTFFLGPPGQIGLQLANSGTDFDNHFSLVPTPRDGKLHHVGVTVDRTAGVSFYVDGVMTEAAPQPFSIVTNVSNGGELYLGRHWSNLSYSLAGVLDEVSIYNRKLAASEIARIYDAGVAGKCKITSSPTLTRVAAGSSHTLVLKTDGTLLATGEASDGELGVNTSLKIDSFVQVLTGVSNVAAGQYYTIALKTDGTLWATGVNYFGQLGDGTLAGHNTFVQVLTGVVSIAVGSNHTLALKTDGTLWATGLNDQGQLGDGTTEFYQAAFEQVLTGVASVAAGFYNTLAVKTDGTLWVTGYNGFGELGDDTNNSHNTFEQVLTDVVSTAAGDYHTMALKSDGTLWATGYNLSGQLGDGTTTDHNTFEQVLTDVATVVANESHSVAVKTDGTLWVTGANDSGQLGDGTDNNYVTTFEQVLTGVARVAAGYSHTLALKSDGTLWVTGLNDSGQLGDCTITSRNTFEQVIIGQCPRNRWMGTGLMAEGRFSPTVTLLRNGKVLVTGGGLSSYGGYSDQYLASAELYDPTTNTWTSTPSMSFPRGFHTATLLQNGRVLIAGGNSVDVQSAEIYDPETNSWSYGGLMTTARDSPTATLLGNGQVLVAAGSYDITYTRSRISSTELYDPITNTWTPTGSLATGRIGHTATMLSTGKVLVAGGFVNDYPDLPFPTAELYDTVSGTWSAAAPPTIGRGNHTATLLGDGKLLVLGGGAYPDGSLDIAEIYDPLLDAWTLAASSIAGRTRHTATLLVDGRVLVAGGQDFSNVDNPNSLQSAELFDANSNSWAQAGSMANSRSSHGATLLPNGNVLVVGNGAEVYLP